MNPPASTSALTALSLLVAACAPGELRPGAVGYAVEDSAGVALVRNTGTFPDREARSIETARLTLRIGVVDGDPDRQFFRLSGLALAPDGSVYASDSGHGEVRVFDAQGAFLRRCGRRGEGPGELQFPTAVWLLGDTMAVRDDQARRVTLFGPDCALLGDWSLTEPGGAALLAVAPAPGGWIAVATRPYAGFPYEAGIERRDTTRLVFVASVSDALAPFARSAGLERPAGLSEAQWRSVATYAAGRRVGVPALMTLTGGESRQVMTASAPLFEPTPRIAVDGLGRVHLSRGEGYVIDTYGPDGRHLRRLTRDHVPVPVTPALVDRYRAQARAYWDTASVGGEAFLGKANDEARPGFAHVASLPPVGRIFASREGALWAERIDLLDDPLELEWRRPPPPPRETRWDRFDPDGRFLGSVALPAGFTPHAVGVDWALGVLRDELEVQFIARFEVEG